MNGRESAVGTHRAYQARAARVNQNCHKLRCKKKELWIFRHILWKTVRQTFDSTLHPHDWAQELDRPPAERHSAGDRTWMTRLAIISRVFAP